MSLMDTSQTLQPKQVCGCINVIEQDLYNRYFLFAAMIKHIGDMAFIDVPHKNQSTDKRARRNAIRYTSALWPNARVPYTISSGFSGKMCYKLVTPSAQTRLRLQMWCLM